MKTFLIMMAAMGLAVAAMAAEQYDYGVDLHKDGYAVKANSTGTKNGWYFSVLENSSLSFTTDLSGTTNNIINKYSTPYTAFNEVGYYVVEGDQVLYKAAFDFSSGVATIGNLEAGQTIGLYVTDLDGTTQYSTRFGASYFGDGDFALNVFNGRDSFGWDGEIYQNRTFAFTSADGSALMGVLVASGPATSGQPLPGIIAVLAIGGGLLARRLRRR